MDVIGYLIVSQGLDATLLDLYEAAEQARGRDAANTTLDPSDIPATIRKLKEYTRYNAVDPLLEHVVFTWPHEKLAHLLIAMREEGRQASLTSAVVMSEEVKQSLPEAIVELAATLAKNPSPHGAKEATIFSSGSAGSVGTGRLRRQWLCSTATSSLTWSRPFWTAYPSDDGRDSCRDRIGSPRSRGLRAHGAPPLAGFGWSQG